MKQLPLAQETESSPLAGLADSNTVSAKDGLFVAFDNDVAKSTLFDADVTLDSENLNLEVLNLGTGVQHSDTNGLKDGWKYYYSNNNGEYKGMNGLYAFRFNIIYECVSSRWCGYWWRLRCRSQR